MRMEVVEHEQARIDSLVVEVLGDLENLRDSVAISDSGTTLDIELESVKNSVSTGFRPSNPSANRMFRSLRSPLAMVQPCLYSFDFLSP